MIYDYDGHVVSYETGRIYADYVDTQGKLIKSGQNIVSSVTGDTVELRGVGTHELLLYQNLHTRACFRNLKEHGVNMIRITVYLQDIANPTSTDNKAYFYGYISHPDETKAEIEKIIEHCIALNMYVLLDWHVYPWKMPSGVSPFYQTEAEAFFTYFCQKYSDCPNMLYEITNEPYRTDAADMMGFIGSIRSIINSYVTDPIIVTGRAQDGVQATYDALVNAGYTDVFVSQHSYNDFGTGKILNLLNAGVPLVYSEWGNSTSTGDGEGDAEAAATFMDFLHNRKIMQSVWKFTDQTMRTSILQNHGMINDYRYTKGFTDEDLTENGHLYLDKFSTYAFSATQ